MIWIGSLLFLASSLFLARSSYEMFILTPLYGPQMVFFSLLHTWPEPAIKLFFASWSAYNPFVCFATLFAILRWVVQLRPVDRWRAHARSSGTMSSWSRMLGGFIGWLGGPPGRGWSATIYAMAGITLLHFVAAMTYDSWAAKLF